MTSPPAPFLRHLEACNNAVLPGRRLPFRLGPLQVGWVGPELAAELDRRGLRREAGALVLGDPARLQALGEALGRAGLLRLRGEPFDVRAEPDGPVLARLDRGALPAFGILADGVHLNGLVDGAEGLRLWVGRRAPDKQLDPDRLDHLAAGGVSAGYGVHATLEKEAAEECGLPPALARQAVAVGTIRYAMERPEGLRRDRLHCFDLMLPDSFRPVPNDGEVAEFSLIPLEEALRLVRDTMEFKFNVNLVLIDLFLRRGLIDPSSPEGHELRNRLNGPNEL